MAAKAGRLQIQLEMQVAQLQRDLNKATREIDSAANNWKSTFKGVFTADLLSSSLSIISGAAQRVIDDMGRISDESKKLGDTAEMYQQLAFAASQTGVAMDAVVAASGRLQKGLGTDAKATNQALKDLGLNVDAIRRSTTGEAFIQVAGALGEVKSSAEQAAIGSALFGKGWQQLLPLIGDGEEALRKAANSAVVASNEAVKAGDDYGDAMEKGQAAVSRFIAEALTPLLPLLTEQITKMTDSGDAAGNMADGFDKSRSSAQSLGETLAGLFKVLNATRENFGQAVDIIALSIRNLYEEGSKSAQIQAQFDAMSNSWSRVTTSFKDVKSAVDSTAELTDAAKEAAKASADAADAAEKRAAAAAKSASASKGEAEAKRAAAAAERERAQAAMEAARAIDQANREQARAEQELQDQLMEQERKVTSLMNERTIAQERLNGATEQEIELLRLRQSGASERELALTSEIQAIETATDASKKKQQELAEESRQYTDVVAAGFTDVFNSMTQGSESATRAIANLITQLLIMFATQKAMKAFGFNTDGSWGWQGAANGAAFNQQGMMAFAQGGIVRSPTPFTFGGGRLGVMGEAGPEAIMPLGRDGQGRLGVRGGGTNVNVHNYAGASISTQAEGDNLDIIVRQVKDSLATDVLRGGNPFSTTLERTYGVRR